MNREAIIERGSLKLFTARFEAPGGLILSPRSEIDNIESPSP